MLRNIRRIAVAATLIGLSFGTLAVTATPAQAQRTLQEQSDFYGGLSGAIHSLETTMSGIQKTTEARNETLERIKQLEKEVKNGRARPEDKEYLEKLKKSAAQDQEFIDKQMEYARKAFDFIERELHRQAFGGLRSGGDNGGSAPRRDPGTPRRGYSYELIHPNGGLDPRTLPIPDYLRYRLDQPASGPNDGLAGPLPKIRGRYDSIDKLNGQRPDSNKSLGATTPLGGTPSQTVKTTVSAPVIHTGR